MPKTQKINEKAHLKKIGERIKDIRKNLGMSQERLAELIEKDRRTVLNLEKGNYDSEITTFFRVAHSLNISFSDLVDLEKDPDSLISVQIMVELEKHADNQELLRRLLALIQELPVPPKSDT